jgi:hypothetical protein
MKQLFASVSVSTSLPWLSVFLSVLLYFFGSGGYETFWLNIDKVTDRQQQGTNPLTNQPLTR